ncbi:hypothetical protein D3C84_1188900 [compost metagenome]
MRVDLRPTPVQPHCRLLVNQGTHDTANRLRSFTPCAGQKCVAFSESQGGLIVPRLEAGDRLLVDADGDELTWLEFHQHGMVYDRCHQG